MIQIHITSARVERVLFPTEFGFGRGLRPCGVADNPSSCGPDQLCTLRNFSARAAHSKERGA